MAILPNFDDGQNEPNWSLFYQNHTTNLSAHGQGKVVPLNRHKILEAILNFVEKNEKKFQANSPGPVCILQIFWNNPSREFQVRAETKCGSGGGDRQTQQKH